MWQRVWIWKRKLKTGIVYCLRWHDENGRVRTEAVGSNRKLAEELQHKREYQLNNGELRATANVTYEEFKTDELKMMRGRLAPSTLVGLERTLRLFESVCGKKMKLAHITPKLVETFFARRLEEVRPATANKEVRTLQAAFNRAIRRGEMDRNPAATITPVRVPEKEHRVLSPDEFAKLMFACPSHRWRAMIALAVTTGLRLGEMLALRHEDVDLKTGTLWVRNTPGHLTKSRRNRVLALAPEICEMLRRLPQKGELLFSSPDGRPLRNNIQRDFKVIVKRAGIPKCSMHDLRRTFVSQLAMAGVNEAIVQKLAGHSSITTTLTYYTHILPHALRAAQDALPFNAVLKDVSYPYHGPEKARKERTA